MLLTSEFITDTCSEKTNSPCIPLEQLQFPTYCSVIPVVPFGVEAHKMLSIWASTVAREQVGGHALDHRARKVNWEPFSALTVDWGLDRVPFSVRSEVGREGVSKAVSSLENRW